MEQIAYNLTSEYRTKKLIVNMPLSYVEHLEKRAKKIMCSNAQIVRFCLTPENVDEILGFTNQSEEEKTKELLPPGARGFMVRPKFKYWHTW